MKKEQLTDDLLVSLYQAGDNKAFDTLLSRYGTTVLNYIHSLVRDEDVAKDIFQNTFFKAIISIQQNKYTANGRFLPWISRIAHNAIVDHLAKEKIKDTLSDQMVENKLANDSRLAERSVEDILLYEQMLEDITRLVGYLSVQQQEVVSMRFFEGLSFNEIAERTHVSVNTALGRMRYALINMRRLAKKNDLYILQ